MPTFIELSNAIRFLSIDAIQKANSGHPGMPMGMADIATVLWREFLHHNPCNPEWLNRDRFILSNGHGSMLQYSLLHLSGYDLSIEDIKQFRQLHSKTPGHPEVGCTKGVETTTGPLGQGLANAVGMALAEKILGATFNRPNFKIIDHYTYVFAGDGCLMEGISHEVCSLAGTHALGKLIVFWDDNEISIDGNVKNWFTDDTAKRFDSYGWHVIRDVDGHNEISIRKAILEAKSVNNRPTLICCKTVIGFGAPNLCNSHSCHGSPLGTKEIDEARTNLKWSYPPFMIPKEIYDAWDAKDNGNRLEQSWKELFKSYGEQYPDLAAELDRRCHGVLPACFKEKAQRFIEKCNFESKNLATRQSSQNCLEVFGSILPDLLGGSADLTPSNLTNWSGSRDLTNTINDGNYLHYGVREFGMFAIMNGLALHGGFIPYGGTFLIFITYGLNAIRMAAMMKQRVIYVLTHDSIGLGEDGPTHQPIEQLATLRLIPNLSVWRPCDSVETAVAWQLAIERESGPTCLALSRQKLSHQKRSPEILAAVMS
jgi:transketolase